jgi:HTH-type transcriptional regulator/antitoxin HigA
MGLSTIDPVAYGKLLATELPRPIRNAREFDRMVARLEELDFSKSQISAEEEALREILAALIQAYDDKHYKLPDQPAHLTVKFLMDQRGIEQADLVPSIGTRAQVSALVSGSKGVTKVQAKKLAAFFQVDAELFL